MSIANNLALEFCAQLENLRKNKGDDEITIGDIDGLFKHLKSNNREDVYEGIQQLAVQMEKIRVEISSPTPDSLTEEVLPDAHLELDAVIKAAENATNEILDCVERIQTTALDAELEIQTKIMDEITKIFEACNFQDITGQRISKVLSILSDVDTCVSTLVDAISDHVSIERKEIITNPDDDLMNGPQHKAPTQDEIDKLFAG